jgi:hypothetical protein
MSSDPTERLNTFTLVGVCHMNVQLAERVLAGAVKMILRDLTLTVAKLMEQNEHERKSTHWATS